MVRPEEKARMGQGGMCGVTSPNIDSMPILSNQHISSAISANGMVASEVQESLSSLLSTGSSDSISIDDLVLKLRSVVNENLELKETVAQNNLALRQQLGLVVQWRQQNEAQQNQLKQEVSKAVQQLSTVQYENSTLKAQLASTKMPEESKGKFNELSDTIKLLNNRLEVAERNLRQAQSDKEKLSVQRSKLEGDITLLKCDLTTSKSEQERLQLERLEFISVVNDLRQQLRQAKEGSVKATTPVSSPIYEGMGGPGGEAILQKLRDQLNKEQDTSSTLLQELHDTRTQVELLECEVQRAQEDASMHKEMCRKLQARAEISQATPAPAQEAGKKDGGNAHEMKKLRDEAAMLREEVDTLETALNNERHKMSDERAALSRSHTEINKLKKEIQDLRDRTERDTHNDQYYQVKIKSLNEKHDEAMAKLMSYEELLAAKNDDLSKLKKDLGQTKAALAERTSESETIAILRAQVEVYQGDFRAEREAREALATDREKLRDEMRHLHTRNTQLVDELEAYQRRTLHPGSGGSRGPSEERGAGSGAAGGGAGGLAPLSHEALWDKLSNTSDKKEDDKKKKEDEIDENLFYCPKCNKSFAEYRPLENHVNRCLDED